MEDGTITRSTLLDIQKFFGLSQPPSSIEESKAFEHRYSENLINSKNEDVDTAEIPKNANEAVRIYFHISLIYALGVSMALW